MAVEVVRLVLRPIDLRARPGPAELGLVGQHDGGVQQEEPGLEDQSHARHPPGDQRHAAPRGNGAAPPAEHHGV